MGARNSRSLHCATPDFLSRLVVSAPCPRSANVFRMFFLDTPTDSSS